MKTILYNNSYKRVDNEIAELKVKAGLAQYAPKSEWKKNVRDLNKQKSQDSPTPKKVKNSKKIKNGKSK